MKQHIGHLLFLLFIPLSLLAQQDKVVSISADSLSQTEILTDLENRYGFRFFYAEDWLNKTEKRSLQFSETPVGEVLDALFQDTAINYYFLEDNQIILTRNAIIYDDLPLYFFGKDSSEGVSQVVVGDQVNNPSPIFYQEATGDTNQDRFETVRIGRVESGGSAGPFVLSGVIRDKTTNSPVPDIAVLVRSRGQGTVTDENGRYSLTLPQGVHLLETRFLGMESIRRRVLLYSNGSLDFYVGERAQVLEEVVLEAEQRRNVQEVVSGTTVIDSEESKDIPLVLGERNILQVATTLPGISKAGEAVIGINVRGGRSDQNMFLLDQAIVYNPTHFFGIFQALNPFVTKNVEIYKGVIPVEYGGRLSSVFDISTVDGDTEKIHGEGSIGPVTANLALELPVKKNKSSLVLGGRGAFSDWILQSLDDEQLSNSQANFYDVIATYTDRINENNRIKATGYYSKDRFSITSDSLYSYSNRAFSLEWNHRYNDNHSSRFILSNSRYAFDIDFDGESNTDFLLGYAVQESEFKVVNTWVPNPNHTLTFGIAAKYYSIDPGAIEPQGTESDITAKEIARERAVEGGIFIADQWQLDEKFSLSFGGRLSAFSFLGPADVREYAEGGPRNQETITGTTAFESGEFIQTYLGPEFRFSARYLLDDDSSIKAGVSNMYQYIHTLSNTTTVSPLDTWKLSDTHIKPQQSQLATLGWFRNFDENMLEVSVEGFYRKSQDVLDFKTGAQLLLNEQIETEVLQGDGRAYGVEFLLKKNRGRLNGWLGYTYSRTQIRFDGAFPEERINNGVFFPANYDRPHDVSLVANYRFTRRYSASLNFAYQTGRPVTYPIGQYNFNNSEYVFYSDRNSFRIPDYLRLDIGVNIEGNHKKQKLAHSFVTVSVYNILGRNNPFSVFFVSEDGEVKALQSSIFAIPIPSITYNFKF